MAKSSMNVIQVLVWKLHYKMRIKKKGLSGVVTTIILVALVVVAITIIWAVINQVVKERLEGAEKCSDLFDKIKLNDVYTCNSMDNTQTQVSVNLEDVTVEKLIISISGQGNSESFDLENGVSNSVIKSFGTPIQLVEKNQGRTYVFNTASILGTGITAETVKISPVIKGKTCGVMDSVELENCGNF